MRSLTNEIHVGNYVARPRQNGFLLRGLTPATRGRKFSLTRLATGRWSVSGTVSNGRPERFRKRFEALGLEEAVEEAEHFLYGRAAGPPKEDLLICDGFSKWEGTLSAGEEARGNYANGISYFLDWCDDQGLRYWKDLRLEHLEAYANGLVRKKKKPRTIKLYTQPVRTASRWASQNWPERYKDFAAGFRLPKPPKEFLIQDPEQRPTLSLRQVAKFLVWLRKTRTGGKLLPGVALQGLCGLRLREVFRLKWEKVDLENGTVTVEGQVKNCHSVRCLPMPQLVREILSQAKRRDAFVVTGYLTDNSYSESIRSALRKWRPGFRLEPKGFRRTLPNVGVREGWHNYALERYLGHSPKTITEKHYVLPTQAELEDLLREEVAEQVDSALEVFLRLWQA